MPTVADAVAFLDAFAPPATAAEWDNVGLLLGESATPLTRVLTCLTVTPEVVAEAVGLGAQLIVSHHPVLFKAAKKLTDADGRGAVTAAAVAGRRGRVLAAHGVRQLPRRHQRRPG